MTGKRKAEATRWYRQAAYDLKAARWNIEGGFHDTACFLANRRGKEHSSRSFTIRDPVGKHF
jgi:HEPN domain